MPRNGVIRALSIHLLFTASISPFTIASSSAPTYSEDAITVPARLYYVEEAKVTAAPELKRQDTTNFCTEWSFANGNNLSPLIVMNATNKRTRRPTRMLCA
jgi:hypothetical protein